MKFYSGNFVSIMAIPIWKKPIDTVEDIIQAAKSDNYLTYTARSLYDIAMEAECCDSLEYHIGQNLKKYKVIRANNYSFPRKVQMINGYDWEAHPMVYITSRRVLSIFGRYFIFPFHISTNNLYVDLVGLVQQKDSLYTPVFSKQ